MSEDGTRELDPNDLEPHPKVVNRYPADEQRELDLDGEPRDSPKVTGNSTYTDADWTIIDGHRRVEALSEAGEPTIEVEVVDTGDSKREEMEAILEYNQYRSKTPGEKVIDAVDWIRVWEDSVETGLENFPSGYRDRLDKKPGPSGKTMEHGLRVWWAAKKGEYKKDKLTDEAQEASEDLWEGLCLGDESFIAHTPRSKRTSR